MKLCRIWTFNTQAPFFGLNLVVHYKYQVGNEEETHRAAAGFASNSGNSPNQKHKTRGGERRGSLNGGAKYHRKPKGSEEYYCCL